MHLGCQMGDTRLHGAFHNASLLEQLLPATETLPPDTYQHFNSVLQSFAVDPLGQKGTTRR